MGPVVRNDLFEPTGIICKQFSKNFGLGLCRFNQDPIELKENAVYHPR